MPRYSFFQLDVFTSRPFGGNQLAVFPDACGLSTVQMQALAREMNFSETSFVLPSEIPGCARKVRIFTPALELPMAGHPTVGTAAVLVERGLLTADSGALTLELGIGPVRVDIEPHAGGLPFAWMNQGAPALGAQRNDREKVAAALGLEPADLDPNLPLETISTGFPFLFVPLISLAAAGRARSERAPLAELFVGSAAANVALITREVTTPEPGQPPADFHARMFSPHVAGISEDPATGSMAGPLGAYAARHGLLPDAPLVTFQIEQGLEMLRPSRITVQVIHEGAAIQNLRVGGESVLVGSGEIFWDEEHA